MSGCPACAEIKSDGSSYRRHTCQLAEADRLLRVAHGKVIDGALRGLAMVVEHLTKYGTYLDGKERDGSLTALGHVRASIDLLKKRRDDDDTI